LSSAAAAVAPFVGGPLPQSCCCYLLSSKLDQSRKLDQILDSALKWPNISG